MMLTEPLPPNEQKLLDLAGEIARDVVMPCAAQVDLKATFPHAALNALREVGLLSVGAPQWVGGLGASFNLMAAISSLLGEACGSVGMIFAMHQAQLVTLCRHGVRQPSLASFLSHAVLHQLLIASATSEAEVGGSLRTSVAFLEPTDDSFRLRKRCPTLSYGPQADAILITGRRDVQAHPGDQILALITRDEYELIDVTEWQGMGMRGTVSASATIVARIHTGRVFEETFREIAASTMVPVSHLLWSACWLGIARNAVRIAIGRLRADARASVADASRGMLLTRAVADLDALQCWISSAASALDRCPVPVERGARRLATLALQTNTLKLGTSRLARDICLTCLECCGLDGYREDGTSSVARAVRDILSAPLMINNQRLEATNAGLLQIVDGLPTATQGLAQ